MVQGRARSGVPGNSIEETPVSGPNRMNDQRMDIHSRERKPAQTWHTHHLGQKTNGCRRREQK